MGDWSFLTSYARVLVCIARDAGARLGDIAFSLDVTEGSAYRIVTDLTAARYVAKQTHGRRNSYQIQVRLPLPEPASQEPAIDQVLGLPVGGPGEVVPVEDDGVVPTWMWRGRGHQAEVRAALTLRKYQMLRRVTNVVK